MCGIFGIVATNGCKLEAQTLRTMVERIFLLSESRGKDASGFLTVSSDEIAVLKIPDRAKALLKIKPFRALLNGTLKAYDQKKGFVVAGHTRMVTNGSEDDPNNNQPVIKDDHVLLHNGIIVNDADLWTMNPALKRDYAVDTEAFAAHMAAHRATGSSFAKAMAQTFADARGANTIVAIGKNDSQMVIGTTNGSMYYWTDPSGCLSLFSSERIIVEDVLSVLGLNKAEKTNIRHLHAKNCFCLNLQSALITKKSLDEALNADALPDPAIQPRSIRVVDPEHYPTKPSPVLSDAAKVARWKQLEELMQPDSAAVQSLRRCTKCLLPETFPFISFDDKGVCQFCNSHKPRPLAGADSLAKIADGIRRSSGEQDCLVPISGGRDSCYGLHYAKKVLGLNPVAYTYDWGFVTDLARRNISRMCEHLEIEHVLIAANIKKKRENVRKNVVAWLNRPQLGMIPLFMAGDKMFFYFASMLRRQMNLGPILFSMNWLEKTGFKAGFAGVNDTASHEKTYGLTNLNKAKLFAYYAKEFALNPGYLNSSLPDTAFGFLSYYLQGKDYYSIFDFLPWNQKEIEETIIGQYDWEISPDTTSTWRIGDGTAPFYNYIYYTVSGFSEHDTFRSNQIREGLMTREQAIKTVMEENRPRLESFVWYCETIGIDPVETVKRINVIPRLYRRS